MREEFFSFITKSLCDLEQITLLQIKLSVSLPIIWKHFSIYVKGYIRVCIEKGYIYIYKIYI